MLYKLVAILALAIAIFHFTGGKNTINVDGISTKMTSRSVVTAVHALTMAETSYRFKFKSELPIATWRESITRSGSRVPRVAGAVISYNENTSNGRYFCLTSDHGVSPRIIDIMSDAYDRMSETGGFEIFINDHCGATAQTGSDYSDLDSISLTVYTGS
ncbi:MAG: hypothetical protein GY774_13415 [Planctomycetes bacterium]|nr:hypothetical protein [Planctomycetota bacterium]